MMRVDEDALIQMSHVVLLVIFFGIGLSIGVAGSVAFLLYYQACTPISCACSLRLVSFDCVCHWQVVYVRLTEVLIILHMQAHYAY